MDLKKIVILFERRFSRFITGNELDVLNHAGGREVVVSPELLALLVAGREAFRVSGGLIDITIGRAMQQIGYDASFSTVAQRVVSAQAVEIERQVHTLDDVIIDPVLRTVIAPATVNFDFGGIGKGYLLDVLAPLLQAASEDYWLSLGGDLYISGHGPDGESWPVGLQDPYHPEQDLGILQLPVSRYAIAASGTTKRSWTMKDGSKHHIVDPRSGTSTETDVLIATVVAESGLLADVLAKTVIILGSEHGLKFLNKYPSTSGVLVTNQQHFRMTPDLQSFVHRS